MTDHNPHFIDDPQPFDWRTWFSRQRATEEAKYQAYKARLMEECCLVERDTMEEHRKWFNEMVKKWDSQFN